MSCCASMPFWVKNCQGSRLPLCNTSSLGRRHGHGSRVAAFGYCQNHVGDGIADRRAPAGRQYLSHSRFAHAPLQLHQRHIFTSLTANTGGGSSPSTSMLFSTSADSDSSMIDIDMILGSSQSSQGTVLSYDTDSASGDEDGTCDIVLVGRKSVLQQDNVVACFLKEHLSCFEMESTHATIKAMLESSTGTVSTFLPGSSSSNKLSLCVLPDKVTRNNHPMSLHTMTDQLRSECGLDGEKDVKLFVVGVKEEEVESSSTKTASPGAVASAVAKAFPRYSRKTSSKIGNEKAEQVIPPQRIIHVTMLDDQTGQKVVPTSKTACQIVSDAVQMAAHLVDMPPNELTTDVYSQVCHALVAQLNDELKIKDSGSIALKEIKGDELRKLGYGGIYNVGKAAECPPRLIEMTYIPNNTDAEDSDAPVTATALVGKAIVFDTGGLSLKSKDGMPGMKHDMGGSAGLLGAFASAVRLGYNNKAKPLTLVLCVAENAIGPNNAMRNDDIITMYSGKTVEINNSDAEGRLVLGDGVAHVTQNNHHPVDLVIDMATLTGAQLVATGKKHAGILATSQELEQRAVDAGLASGDLCFPLLYAPELLQSEFASKVADMKNSVKDRGNAQTSCAGHFIESHLSPSYKGEWLHVDMAGPGTKEERGTGYGVGFVLSLLKVPGF